MKPYQRLGLILLASLLASCLIAPFVAYAISLLRGMSPSLSRALDFPFDRAMRRVVLVAAVLALYRYRARLDIMSLASLGLRREPDRWRLLFAGWLLGACSLALMLALMIPCGSRRVVLSFTGPWDLLQALAKAFLSGAVVAAIEEPFFRGFVLQTLMKNLRRRSAVVAMSLFFAIVHFFNAPDLRAPRGFAPLLGFKAVGCFLAPLLHPAAVLPGFIGLFLVGVVLARAYLRTGSLYLSIGLHAGWVFGIKAEGQFLDRVNNVAPWFFGDGKVVTGVFGWLMLLAMLAVIGLFPAAHERREQGGKPS